MTIYDVEYYETGDDPYMAGWRSGWLYLDRANAEIALAAALEKERNSLLSFAEKSESEKTREWALAQATPEKLAWKYRVVERTTKD